MLVEASKTSVYKTFNFFLRFSAKYVDKLVGMRNFSERCITGAVSSKIRPC